MNNEHTFTTPRKNTVVTVFNRQVDISTPSGQRAHTILRQCELMVQSGTFINDSNNIDTVMRNIPLYEKTLGYLSACPDQDLKMCRLKSSAEFKGMRSAWEKDKIGAINNAIVRSTKAVIARAKTLKTEKGQAKHILAHVNKCLALPGLSSEAVAMLQGIKADMESALQKNK